MNKILKTACMKNSCLNCDHYFCSLEYTDGYWAFGHYTEGTGYDYFYCNINKLSIDKQNSGEIKDNCKYHTHRKSIRLKDDLYVIRNSQKIPYKDI